MDFVTEEERITKAELYERVAGTKTNYFRCGIAFDEFYKVAFLEQELSGSALFDNKAEPVVFHDNNVTKFLRRKGVIGAKEEFFQEKAGDVIVFQTKSCFFDGEKGEYHDLHSSGIEKGVRIPETCGEFWADQIDKTSRYLNSTVNEDGSFVYGYFTCHGSIVPGYNIIRHILCVMALMDFYEFCGDAGLLENIKKTFDYVLREAYKEVDAKFSVIVDHANGDEIRLGALGLGIIMMVRYGEVFGSDEYLDDAKKLANFIIRLQNEGSGNFTHVLSYPDLAVKEEFKIVYYSGEACYGLMSLYEKVRDDRYLDSCKRAFDFFIDNDYHKYFDHWLAYAANEITKYAPEDKYFEFGIKNAMNKIDFITERETTYATMLEMLNASNYLFNRIKELGKTYLFEGYDIDKFESAKEIRAKRQLNGVMFPEMAMFFKNPKLILYGTFIRHHSFRVRNDDVAHHIIGYINYLKK